MGTTACCATTQKCSCQSSTEAVWESASPHNSLAFSADLCINCGLCSAVCPHGVFAAGEKKARLVRAMACMECGACQRNCPVGAIRVDSGVGCAAAMIYAALTGQKEATCGGAECGSETNCC